MSVRCRTAGLTISIDSPDPGWLSLAAEACAGHDLGPAANGVDDDVVVLVEPTGGPEAEGLRVVTRGALAGEGRAVLTDACGSGLDLELTVAGGQLRVRAWPRPTWRHRGLGVLAPARRVLLHRAALIQYPALWWAGIRGLVPLHVCAATVSGVGLLIAGPGGVGKSTLLATLGADDVAVSDNVCAADAERVHGLLEPIRDERGEGRRMPHGRHERVWLDRADSLAPQRVIVLRRGSTDGLAVRAAPAGVAARELTAGTYAAGELRRYWAFAATLALALDRGPAHPPVAAVSDALAQAMPCTLVELPSVPGATLAQIVARAIQVDGDRLTAPRGRAR